MFTQEGKLYVAQSPKGPLFMNGKMANRHGLIAGATGTGKTVSLQVLAETFSQAGVPCFVADMKGDLSGISQVGKSTPFIEKRQAEFGIPSPLDFSGCPVRFFDLFGKQGHPLRTTISDVGPILLSRLLGLNETQSGIMNVVFKIADDNKLLLIDMKDLRAMLEYVSKHAKEYSMYGHIAPQSVGAIQRSLLALDSQGADHFFGEPAFNPFDMIQTEGGRGIVNVLAADELMQNPKLYSTFLLWLLSDLYANLPEVGDMALPKFVFFFDEAHTLFKDTSPALVDTIERVVRLIRSKGVGVYFVTQMPTDIPDSILGQLGNRFQHALRAFTPKDRKSIVAIADTFRTNPEFETVDALMSLGTGEAMVSLLDDKGAPTIVEKAKMLFPLSSIGAITPESRTAIIRRSRLAGVYDQMVDRQSAYEDLADQAKEDQRKVQEAEDAAKRAKEQEQLLKQQQRASSGSRRMTPIEKMIGSATTSIGRSIGNVIIRSILGSIFKKK